jgi:hypothetical protein
VLVVVTYICAFLGINNNLASKQYISSIWALRYRAKLLEGHFYTVVHHGHQAIDKFIESFLNVRGLHMSQKVLLISCRSIAEEILIYHNN